MGACKFHKKMSEEGYILLIHDILHLQTHPKSKSYFWLPKVHPPMPKSVFSLGFLDGKERKNSIE